MTEYLAMLGRSLSTLKGAFRERPYPPLSETPFSDDREAIYKSFCVVKYQVSRKARQIERERSQGRSDTDLGK